MKRDWLLEITPEKGESSYYHINLGIKDAATDNVIDLVSSINSFEGFQKEVSLIKEEMDQLLEKAQKRIKGLHQEIPESEEFDSEKIWQKMVACASEEEMFEYFNSFNDSQRKEIADYIFVHVNMFKGRGPIFAQNYNIMTHFLD